MFTTTYVAPLQLLIFDKIQCLKLKTLKGENAFKSAKLNKHGVGYRADSADSCGHRER
jgi:hypothetical protein